MERKVGQWFKKKDFWETLSKHVTSGNSACQKYMHEDHFQNISFGYGVVLGIHVFVIELFSEVNFLAHF